MHDAAHLYERDTEVVDLDDFAPSPAIGRIQTEDLVAHVIVSGQRHRRTPDLKETACGSPIHSGFAAPVREQLTLTDGGLCSICFTPHELKRAAENDESARQFEEAQTEKRDAADEARRAKRWKRPTSQGDR